MSGSTNLAGLRDAYARHDWSSAYDAAVAAGDDTGDAHEQAERLDLLADASWWLGRLTECIDARERAYAAYDEIGANRAAGQCAVWLYEHNCFQNKPAAAGAWLRRARRALEGDVECLEYGALLLREAEVAHGSGELDHAVELANDVFRLARRLRSVDLEAQALQTRGRVLIDQREVNSGMADLDEAMLLAVEGRLGPYATGKVYCSLISACEQYGDLRRAAEWTEATGRWAEQHPFSVFPGLCRVHRASAMHRQGSWAEAEREATRAVAELAQLNLPNAAAAYAEIGEIRRRLGDLDGAQAAFAKSEEVCGRPAGGLALLRLAEGRTTTAVALITQALADETTNQLARARLLSTAAHIAVAVTDYQAAQRYVDELAVIAGAFGSPLLSAMLASAEGRVQLAHGDPAAGGTLRRAVRSWQELDVPYEVATARMLLGLTCRDAGDGDAAQESFLAAAGIFEQLGATADVAEVRELCAPSEKKLPAGLTDREAQVLALLAAGRSNRAIAEELWLSHKTVARHVSNIFAKIGVTSRVAAATFAVEHDLVP